MVLSLRSPKNIYSDFQEGQEQQTLSLGIPENTAGRLKGNKGWEDRMSRKNKKKKWATTQEKERPDHVSQNMMEGETISFCPRLEGWEA